MRSIYIEAHVKVKTIKQNNKSRDDFTLSPDISVKWDTYGYITGYSNSHGLCFQVTHFDGSIGYYDPQELILVDPETKF